jgi:hypothetical protein
MEPRVRADVATRVGAERRPAGWGPWEKKKMARAEQFRAERSEAGAGNLRHAFVARVGNNLKQFGESFAADRRDNAELGEVRSDRTDGVCVKHQATLHRHLCALNLNEPPCTIESRPHLPSS